MLIHGLETSSHLAVDTTMLVCLFLQHVQSRQGSLQALAHGVGLILQPGVLGPGDHHKRNDLKEWSNGSLMQFIKGVQQVRSLFSAVVF